MLQPISQYYALSDLRVSFIFLVGPIGYVIAAQSNELVHTKLGQRGISLLGPIFHIVAAGAIAVHPPYYITLVAFAAVALGTGLLDGSWCAWAGSMSKANTVSGLLHGSFSVGAAAGPLLASTMMTAGHRPWYEWYYVLVSFLRTLFPLIQFNSANYGLEKVGVSVSELVVLLAAFRYEDSSRYLLDKHTESNRSNPNSRVIFKYREIWLSAAYFLAYVGTETAVSGWVISFMTRARHATPYLSSLSSSGFWAGMAVGRLALGTVTDRIGVRRATIVYFSCTVALEVLFAVVRIPAVSVIIMTLDGFFKGPLFPSGIVVLAQLLPKELHIVAVSFVASVGQVGGALLPFGIGAVVEGVGIWVFQYATIVLSIVSLGLWVAFSRLRPMREVASLDEDDSDGGSDEEE